MILEGCSYESLGRFSVGGIFMIYGVTRKDIINWLCGYFNASDYVLVDEFESNVARHICKGSRAISLLQENTVNVPIPDKNNPMVPCAVIPVNVFFCGYCGKLIINKQSLDLV